MNPIQTVARRTADDIDSMRRASARLAPRLDLRDLINAKLEFPSASLNTASISAWSELSEACRQRSGIAPLGTWLPLAALSRDLTSSGASSISIGTLNPTAAAGLLPSSAVLGAGATVLTGLTGTTFSLPAVDPSFDSTGLWLAEGDTAPQREPSFKTILLSPRQLTVQMIVSRRLLQNSSVDLDALLRTEIAGQLGRALDAAAISGAGSATEPQGLLANAELEVVSAGTNGAAPTWAHIVELKSRVAARAGGNSQVMTYLMPPGLAKKLQTTQRAAGLDFIMNDARLLGDPVRVSPAMPQDLSKGGAVGTCAALVYGDVSEIIVGFWGPAAIDLLVDGRTLPNGAVRLVARADVGIGIRRPKSFAAYKDLVLP